MATHHHATMVPYPGAGGAIVPRIAARVHRTDSGGLCLDYQLDGLLEDIVIPPPQPPSFRNELWKHTCFEAFLATAEHPGYFEFNFSPSGEWAVYRFADYRRPEGSLVPAAPGIAVKQKQGSLHLTAFIDADCLPCRELLQLGLAAVIEAADGSLSYWALAHPAERPDFHDRRGFILTIAP